MKAYFIRRLLLVPLTMLGVTFLVFMITRAVPGGPMERALQQAQQAAQESGGSGQEAGGLTEEQVEELEEEYGWDKPAIVAYLQWLGVWPRDRLVSKKEFNRQTEATVGGTAVEDPKTETLVVLKGDGREVLVKGSKQMETVTRKEWVVAEEEGEDGEEELVREKVERVKREVEVWAVESARFVEDGEELGEEIEDGRLAGADRVALRPPIPVGGAEPEADLGSSKENYEARADRLEEADGRVCFRAISGRSTSFGDPVIELIMGPDSGGPLLRNSDRPDHVQRLPSVGSSEGDQAPDGGGYSDLGPDFRGVRDPRLSPWGRSCSCSWAPEWSGFQCPAGRAPTSRS